jgi:hypothetical protein
MIRLARSWLPHLASDSRSWAPDKLDVTLGEGLPHSLGVAESPWSVLVSNMDGHCKECNGPRSATPYLTPGGQVFR